MNCRIWLNQKVKDNMWRVWAPGEPLSYHVLNAYHVLLYPVLCRPVSFCLACYFVSSSFLYVLCYNWSALFCAAFASYSWFWFEVTPGIYRYAYSYNISVDSFFTMLCGLRSKLFAVRVMYRLQWLALHNHGALSFLAFCTFLPPQLLFSQTRPIYLSNLRINCCKLSIGICEYTAAGYRHASDQAV